MLTKELAKKQLQKIPTFANQLEQIATLMITSGLHTLLIEAAKPRVIGAQFPHHDKLSASEASRSIGYFEALNDILHFRDLYLTEPAEAPKSAPVADYGAKARLTANKTVTSQEAQRLGHKPVTEAQALGIK